MRTGTWNLEVFCYCSRSDMVVMKKSKKILTLIALCVCFSAGLVRADYDPPKWLQTPDVTNNGLDVMVTYLLSLQMISCAPIPIILPAFIYGVRGSTMFCLLHPLGSLMRVMSPLRLVFMTMSWLNRAKRCGIRLFLQATLLFAHIFRESRGGGTTRIRVCILLQLILWSGSTTLISISARLLCSWVHRLIQTFTGWVYRLFPVTRLLFWAGKLQCRDGSIAVPLLGQPVLSLISQAGRRHNIRTDILCIRRQLIWHLRLLPILPSRYQSPQLSFCLALVQL